VDAKDVRKHLNDVLRLSQLLAPATRIALDKKISDDMTDGEVNRRGVVAESASCRLQYNLRPRCGALPRQAPRPRSL
jgi:hypothetical protein